MRSIKWAVQALLAFLAALLIWEILLQLTTIRSTGYNNDPVLGKIAKEGTYINGQEGYGWTRIYAEGAIGRPFPDASAGAKPPGEKRILFIGDSFTEANQVMTAVKFPFQVERKLKQDGPWRIESFNAGRSSASPAYYIHLADYYHQRIAPDYVVVQINEDDLKDLRNRQGNFYIDEAEGRYQTVFNDSFRSTNAIAARLDGLYHLLEFSTIRVASEKVQKLLMDEPAKKEEARDAARDLALTEWTLAELQRKYPKLVVLFLPTIDFSSDGDLDEQGYFERLVAQAARDHQIDLINMRGPFADLYRQQHKIPYGFANTQYGLGHMNAYGHDITSDLLVDYFREKLIQ